MTIRTAAGLFTATLFTIVLLAAPVSAQERKPARPAAAPRPPAAPLAPAPTANPPGDARPSPAKADATRRRNVSIEVKILDQSASAEPATKLVTVMVADGQSGSVRSGTREFPNMVDNHAVTLNVDVAPTVSAEDSIRLGLTLEYRPASDSAAPPIQLNERVSVTLESGKPLVVSRAVDPSGNRKISVEVTATLMK